ncbi:hypothetical protein LINPERPRIM_LOCUS44248 [Linum perenne]
MGPLTSSYVLCGSREANEGKLFELSPPAAYVVGGLIKLPKLPLLLGFVPEAKLKRRVASPLLHSLWRRKLEELTAKASSISLFPAWEKQRTLEAKALFTFGHEDYSVISGKPP